MLEMPEAVASFVAAVVVRSLKVTDARLYEKKKNKQTHYKFSEIVFVNYFKSDIL